MRHVTLEEAIRAGRVKRDWAAQRRVQWGESSQVYQNRVLGNFADAGEDSVIPLSWVEAANRRWEAWDAEGRPGNVTALGVDVGRGGDKTVIATRRGWAIEPLAYHTRGDLMATTGLIVVQLRKHRTTAVVDVIGIGAGVVDRLRELDADVRAFNAAAKTDESDRSGELAFLNQRSAAWWRMRELLDPGAGEPVALPPDDVLTGDLTAPRWKVTSAGKVQIESKEEIRAHIGRSTDAADAVCMAFSIERRASAWYRQEMARVSTCPACGQTEFYRMDNGLHLCARCHYRAGADGVTPLFDGDVL